MRLIYIFLSCVEDVNRERPVGLPYMNEDGRLCACLTTTTTTTTTIIKYVFYVFFVIRR